MTEVDKARLKELALSATPGEWSWFGNVDTQSIYLATKQNGRQYIMQFVRWGMQGGAPRFQVDGRMTRADELVEYEVCPEAESREDSRVYRGDFHHINHPDARYIAALDPETVLALLEENERLTKRNERLQKQVDKYWGK